MIQTTNYKLHPLLQNLSSRDSYPLGLHKQGTLFEQSNIEIEYEDGYTQREIGGVTFDRMDVTLNMQGVEINQSYYVAKHKKYVVMLTATPGDGVADPILEGITFDW